MTTLNYEISGTGEPIVLIHGHPFDHTMWGPQVSGLSIGYKVITPDLRGYGASSLPAGKTTFEDYATDVLQLLDHLKIACFHLGGLSLGGQVIMEIFRQAPHRVLSLIFADTFVNNDTPEVKQGRYDAAIRLEREGMDNYADEVIGKMIRHDHVTTMPDIAAHVMQMMKGTLPAAAAAALRARSERRDYLAEVFPTINVPCLAIVGRQDEFTPVSKAEEIMQNLADCKLVIIEDAGHMPNLEQPEQFNRAVLDFLKNIH